MRRAQRRSKVAEGQDWSHAQSRQRRDEVG
jgi:hypothetical protein